MTADALPAYAYPGGELELFAQARNWKSYFARVLRPFIGGSVLEVGAGLGATTKALCSGDEQSWLCLEPDTGMAVSLAEQVAAGELPAICRAKAGTVADLLSERGAAPAFDCVLYIDVIEHIADDAEELRRASRVLRSGGRLVVLSPAFQWLYTPFDAAIGHVRRYDRLMIDRLTPPGLVRVAVRYLDSVGLLASLANRLVLRSQLPTARQIQAWDRFMVPASQVVDRIFGRWFGRSIVAVWRKE
ncbi:MAG: class I SAM-dependent methyltransferase [Rhodospirillales bacterium]|nr:class I SAM-dependent methyltransferase [Rhodospirillales bacterium]